MKLLDAFGHIKIELLSKNGRFEGLGKIWIDEIAVRTGRLPLTAWSVSFSGEELCGFQLLGVEEADNEVRIRLAALFTPAKTKPMRDHSLDPIHDTGDWDVENTRLDGELDLVLRPASDSFNGVTAKGFSYHYEYRGKQIELFHLLDKASWELEEDIRGATIVSQSACSDPVVRVDDTTAWSTEGLIHWRPDIPNPVMTHNLPRWASHQAFDFQWKNNRVLLGVFERVELIRSIQKREPEAAELKCFDKYIFDQSLVLTTVPKKILLADNVPTETAMRNLWTWVMTEVHDRARAEFGLAQEPTLPRLSLNFWSKFDFTSYDKNLLAAARNLGIRQVFIDNVNKSAMSENGIGNTCCGHEYEPAPLMGGDTGLKALVDRAKADGIQIMSWTNNAQAVSSPLNASERDEKGWYVKMEDTRTKYGGAYTNVLQIWDFNKDDARRNWIDSLKKTRERTGLNGYLFDSFYNLGFMPVNHAGGNPRTMWRQCLSALKELQEADIHFLIESFGPFGQSQHGCPRSYSVERCWVCFEINVGNDYTTVPTGLPPSGDASAERPEMLHFILAHKTLPSIPLLKDGKRVDERWTDAHKRVLADYHEARPHMKHRYLQENGKCVIWHNAVGDTGILWNFNGQEVSLPGQVFDLTAGWELPASDRYELEPGHTYKIESSVLPIKVDSPG